MQKKMLYLMNIDWNWIKQRPQFMAEGLSKVFETKIVYQYQYTRKNYQKRSYADLDIVPMYPIPKLDRFGRLRLINDKLKKNFIQRIMKKFVPDYIYCTLPVQIHWIENSDAFIIYDCMDNHAALFGDKDIIKADEKAMCKRADLILCSSEKLVENLCGEYGDDIRKKTIVVRNGYDGQIVETSDNKSVNDNVFKFCYFGTIGEWFNTEYIERSLQDFENIEYVIIGPFDRGTLPEHPRVKYCGTVEHAALYDATRDMDCFIMPFKVNDVVSAVDPVKLYEYINFNKDILCVEYPEIKRFHPFVYFYSDYDEFKVRIEEIMLQDRIKYSQDERNKFLTNNSWDCRVEQIVDKLKNAGVY